MNELEMSACATDDEIVDYWQGFLQNELNDAIQRLATEDRLDFIRNSRLLAKRPKRNVQWWDLNGLNQIQIDSQYASDDMKALQGRAKIQMTTQRLAKEKKERKLLKANA